ncbi:hypothetical protein T484DRAFT_1830694 [Baffinella frigidus]|nr:hypothetical protein T484DRAFT_1830694 [Cryptophyta sp. CCMP2293]
MANGDMRPTQLLASIEALPLRQACMGVVEVVEPHDRAYFKASLLDMDEAGKKFFIRYVGETESLWVDAVRVRRLPMGDVVDFNPKEGDKVEVSFAEDGEPESWWEGTVFQRKGDFFVITFPDNGTTESREVVEYERLRPAFGHSQTLAMRRVNFPVPNNISANDMRSTQDSLFKLAKLADLFVLSLAPNGKTLVALGDDQGVQGVGGKG